MRLNDPRHTRDDREVITYEAMANDKQILIAIDRETIDDYLGARTLKGDERLAWVKENMAMLTRCAGEKLRHTPDVTGVMLGIDDLPARPD